MLTQDVTVSRQDINRQLREDADHHPGVEVNRADARESWRDLATVIAFLP